VFNEAIGLVIYLQNDPQNPVSVEIIRNWHANGVMHGMYSYCEKTRYHALHLATAGRLPSSDRPSLVDLLAPHMDRSFGFRRVRSYIFLLILIGASLWLIADWLGRVLIFPR
jgi:ABC-type enterochelin transport system permease subunit